LTKSHIWARLGCVAANGNRGAQVAKVVTIPTMSARFGPSPAVSASMSSSGYADGLGRRSISFDREDGSMLERLIVRPELAAFEPALRDRLERLAAIDDERIARPKAILRESDGALAVVSEFVPGSRLADLLDSAVQRGTIPGVDVAFGYLLDVLPALCGLHAAAGFSHGAISPGRIVITPAGQVVLLDAVFGGALQCMNYSRGRLWAEFDIAVRPAAGPVRFDPGSDVAQVALTALMLVIGRPVQPDEYPNRLSSLLLEVSDVAMIRGSADFASGLQTFLQRALPLPSARPYTAADDALFDLRSLAEELGSDACHRALTDFVEQMEGGGLGDTERDEYEDEAFDAFDAPAATNDVAEELELAVLQEEEEEEEEEEQREQFDDLDEPEPGIYELSSPEVTDDLLPFLPTVQPPAHTTVSPFDGWHGESDDASAADQEASPQDAIGASSSPEADAGVSNAIEAADGSTSAATEDAGDRAETAPAEEPAHRPNPAEQNDAADVAGAVAAQDEPAPVPAQAPDASGGSRRRKRNRSVKSRKDKLRSTTAPAPALVASPGVPAATPAAPPIAAAPARIPVPAAPPVIELPAPAAPKPAPATGSWLVPPDRAASFEPPVADPFVAAPAPPLAPPPAVQHVPFGGLQVPPQAPSPAPVAPPVQPALRPMPPVAAVPAIPPAPQPALWVPPPVTAPNIPVIGAPQPPSVSSSPGLKLKAQPKKVSKASSSVADIYSAAPVVERPQPRGSMPWKSIAAAAALLIGGAAGWPYISKLPATSKIASAAKSLPAGATAPAKPSAAATPAKSGTGRIEIETQPAGARVFLDGKPAGETPLAIDSVSVGRHTLTFESSAGTIRRTVRVEAGKTLTVDVPIYSGWVGIFAPIVLDVAANGRSIGTTEESRLMLPPGRHELTLSNKELGYSVIQTVDIEPGEVRSVTLDPQGVVNVNAAPWAEVWIDGRKAGDTPIANLKLPLGAREILFKHPQFGERRVTVTVKANAPGAVTVDMRR
jgi:hypothetical protein